MILGVVKALLHCSKPGILTPYRSVCHRAVHWRYEAVIASNRPPVAYPRAARDRSVALLSASRGVPQRRPRAATVFFAKAARAMLNKLESQWGKWGPRGSDRQQQMCVPSSPGVFPCGGSRACPSHFFALTWESDDRGLYTSAPARLLCALGSTPQQARGTLPAPVEQRQRDWRRQGQVAAEVRASAGSSTNAGQRSRSLWPASPFK